jgi:hypothetical protein
MATITIDNKEYDTDRLSDEAKAQLLSLQFCEAELMRYQALAAAAQTARIAYATALKSELDKPEQGETEKGKSKEADKKKKGLMGMFGKS